MTRQPSISTPAEARALRIPVPAVASLLVGLSACAPELPEQRRAPGTAEENAGPSVRLEPAASLDAAPSVLRVQVRLDAARSGQVDLARILFLHGRVGPRHLLQIEEGEISKALSERVVPSIAWLDDAAPDETWVVVAPVVPLAPGEIYAVVGGDPLFSHHLQVAAEGTPPVLPRIWPPIDGGATLSFGVWCGDAPLSEGAGPAGLAPDGPQGELQRGAVDDIGARCLRFEATPGPTLTETDERRFVGPPIAGSDPPAASLDPRPFAIEADPAPPPLLECGTAEVRLGPGCAEVMDDRLLVRSAEVPLLWALAGEGLDTVVATGPGDPFVLSPLPSRTSIALTVATVDNAGHVERGAFASRTLAPMPHVIISEVLANPLGPEPAQEWVELYNDGEVLAELGGTVLADVGGEIALPPALLAPGAYALVVNETYAELDELDPAPPSGALLLRVAKLGNHGLSNAGEPLQLRKDGVILSRSPAAPAPKAGMSLARVHPRAPDRLSGSFLTSWPTPGRENIINEDVP
jgi:hypothetical protein